MESIIALVMAVFVLLFVLCVKFFVVAFLVYGLCYALGYGFMWTYAIGAFCLVSLLGLVFKNTTTGEK